jgi:hypothetical protein
VIEHSHGTVSMHIRNKIHLASCLISNGDVAGTADISVTTFTLQGNIKLILPFNMEKVIL